MGFGRASIALSSEDPAARAAVLAREADALLAADKVAEACDKLAESQRLDPRGATVLDLALCRERQGRLGTALRHFQEAEAAADTEKRSDRKTTAKTHRQDLAKKVAKLSLTLAADANVPGLRVWVGVPGDKASYVEIPQPAFSEGFVVDTGECSLWVVAPEREPRESVLKFSKGEKRTVTIAPLAPGAGPPAWLGAPPASPEEAPPKSDEPAPEAPAAPVAETPAPPPPKVVTEHSGGRLVIDIGAMAGGHLSLLEQAPLSDLDGTLYEYESGTGTRFLAACGNETAVDGAGSCQATFSPALSGAFGGQIFVGYALSPSVQLGGRVLGGVTYPLGYFVLGGPSLSGAVGPFFLGGTLLFGTSQVEAPITGARGSVPSDFESANDSSSYVPIAKGELAGSKNEVPFRDEGATADAFGSFEVGATIEVSLVLADNPTDDAGSGALLLSAWPTGTWSPGLGGGVWLPVGLGYRFY